MLPTIEQINSSELFALHAPWRDQSENDNDDEEGPREEADIHHLWLPYLEENRALEDQAPNQFEPLDEWPKVYTPDGLQNHFPMGVTAWQASVPLPSLILMIPPNSPKLDKDHFLRNFHSYEALKRYSLGAGKDRKQFAFCPYCRVQFENQVAAFSHVRRHVNYEYLCEVCAKYHTCNYSTMKRHILAKPQRGHPGKKNPLKVQLPWATHPTRATVKVQPQRQVTTKQHKGSI